MMNQTEAAEFLGVSKVLISQWLKGVRTPSLDMAVKIQQHTGIQEESWLLTEVSTTPESVSADADKSTV